MDLGMLDAVLDSCEMRLKAQERLRRLLGVRSVERPTYERYITGPIKRHHSQYNAFAALKPENDFGDEWRKTYKSRTGVNNFAEQLPASELEPGDRLLALFNSVTPGFFQLLRIPRLAGRDFTAADDAFGTFLAEIAEVAVRFRDAGVVGFDIAGAEANCISVEHMPWNAPLFNESMEIEDGMLRIPERPGTGFTFDKQAVNRFSMYG